MLPIRSFAGRRPGRTMAAVAAVLTTMVCAAFAPAAQASAAPLAHTPTSSSTAASTSTAADARPVCAAPARAGMAACMSLVRTDVPQLTRAQVNPAYGPTGVGYGPSSLQNAYKLPSATNGAGQTVAVVDAYDDPDAVTDLAAYRSAWGLAACNTSTGAGCLTKINESGAASPLPPASGTSGWATEESLDVDMVAAICPNCRILLAEANSPSYTDLGNAVNSAVQFGAKFVSNSYGGSESASDPSYDSTYYNHPGVAITASAGDYGYSSGVEYPAASQYVTAVGGTSLTTASNSRGWTETVWSGTGSGCSADDAKPTWQADSGCVRRTDNDVSAVADPNTGVAVYDSYDQSGWLEVGGTSASSPIIASVYALAGTPAAGSYPSSYPYAHTGSLYDVTSGNNGTCTTAYLCTAEVGYDGPTGWGTPDGTGAFLTAPPVRTIGTESVGRNADGRLQVFARGSDSAIWTDWQTTPDGAWSGWTSLSGDLASTPAVAANASGDLQVLAQGVFGSIWSTTQTTPGGPFGAWTELVGSPSAAPTVAVNTNGDVQVFAVGSGTAIWTATQGTPGGAFGAWTSLGGDLASAPAVAANASGDLQVFAQGTYGSIWSTTQSTPGGAFGAWTELVGSPSAAPTVAVNANGDVQVFTLGPGSSISTSKQATPGGAFGAWTSLGGSLTSVPAVGANASGDLQVFAVGSGTAIWSTTQTTPGGAFGAWTDLNGNLISAPVVAANANGDLEVFAEGSISTIWSTTQTTPGGTFVPWFNLG